MGGAVAVVRLRGVLGFFWISGLRRRAAHFGGVAGVLLAGFFLAALLGVFGYGWMLLVLGLLAAWHGFLSAG
jgi:hypothetical protein